jgi:hypothetical protein
MCHHGQAGKVSEMALIEPRSGDIPRRLTVSMTGCCGRYLIRPGNVVFRDRSWAKKDANAS